MRRSISLRADPELTDASASADIGRLAEAASPSFGAGAFCVAVAAGWGTVALCCALEPGAGPASGIAGAAASLWWIAVVAIVRSDIADYLIPDEASGVIALLGLAQAVALPLAAGAGPTDAGLAGLSALGTGAGAVLLFWTVGFLFRRLGGRDALGFGDVKLAGASAIWLAPGDAALALEIAALGAVAVLAMARHRGGARDTAVPFGAFMAPAAWLVYVAAPVLRDLLP